MGEGVPTIAVIDDDPLFVELIETLLQEEGYQTLSCLEGEWAYDLIARAQPDMVLLDIRMEYATSGWDVLTLLRLDPTTADVPVVVCSADLIFLQRMGPQLESNNCIMLAKPFEIGALLEAIAICVGQPQATRALGESSLR